jgi:hypothetical protein
MNSVGILSEEGKRERKRRRRERGREKEQTEKKDYYTDRQEKENLLGASLVGQGREREQLSQQ